MSINKVILVGNVGKDPEIRHLDNGVAVANFTLATSETYLAKNGDKVTSTEWHNVVLWRSLAEIAEKYVRKGRQVYIEGKIRSRSYEDREGIKRNITEIYGDVLQLLGNRESNPQGIVTSTEVNTPAAHPAPKSAVPPPEQQFDLPAGDEDLPF